MDNQMQTTFLQDFLIAEVFGANAVKATFNRAFEEWKTNYVYLTELVLVLNWRIFAWYDKNPELAELYNELWEKADMYAMDNLKDEELAYFLQETD